MVDFSHTFLDFDSGIFYLYFSNSCGDLYYTILHHCNISSHKNDMVVE